MQRSHAAPYRLLRGPTRALDASPDLITQIEHQSLDEEQIKKIKTIVLLIKKIELKSNAKLNWFTDLDKHLKRTLANEL